MDEQSLRIDLLSVVKCNLSAYSKNLLFTGVVDKEGHLTLPRKITSDMEAYAYGNTMTDNNSLSKIANEMVNNIVKIIKDMPRGICGCNNVLDESGKVDN